MKMLIAVLLGLLGVFGGIAVGIGTFTYGIYLTVLMVKGTLAATFLYVLGAVVCIGGSGILGWIWGLFWMGVASVIGGSEFSVRRKGRRVW